MQILRLMVTLIAANLFAHSAVCHATSPNVIVILADDQGWGDLSRSGNVNLSTPHIDSLARHGASFENFYVGAVCAPTRAELLTGRYHSRSGVRGVSTGQERMDAGEVTIADLLKDAGYQTAAFGKWHNGTQYPYHPNARGFDEFIGFCSGHWGHYFDPFLEHNTRPIRGEGYLTNYLVDQAIEFLRDNKGRPTFVYLPLNIPHSPMQVPDEWYAKFADAPLKLRGTEAKRESLSHTRAALAMCENIDANVGRLLASLDELGMVDSTVVVYFSDNGPNGHRWNGGMKGIKGSVDEGGVRSPCFIRYPSAIRAKTEVRSIAGAIDLLPTLCELTGATVRSKGPLDGRSLVPLLTKGDTHEWPERTIFSHWGGRVSARTDRYRLDNNGKLFDMVADPSQSHDIAADKPEFASDLVEQVATFRREVVNSYPGKPRPFDIGAAGSPRTWLPARDGVGHGNIKRSSRHPNCSYFTNWITTDDYVSWNVRVHEPGRYRVTLYHSCAEKNTGCELTLKCGNATASCVVTEPNDPPDYGDAQDRDGRTESLVKDFAPLDFGQIELAEGDASLELRADKIPGDAAVEVRLLVLEMTKSE